MRKLGVYAVGRDCPRGDTIRLVMDQCAEGLDADHRGRTAAILTFDRKADAATCARTHGTEFYIVLLSRGILSRVYFGRRLLDSLKRAVTTQLEGG